MYHILLLPIIAGLITQISKFFIKTNKKQISLKNMLMYAGMPSGHAAIVVSLAAIIGLELGWGSPLFAFGLIFAIIIIRDALGLRQYLGQHGRVLNILVKDLKNDQVLDQQYPHLLERIGHTPAQIIVGALIGLAVSLTGYWLLN
jgi:uncharacterized protein